MTFSTAGGPFLAGYKSSAEELGEIVCTSGIAAERNDVEGLIINSHCTNNDKDIGGDDNMDVHQENDPPFDTKLVAHETIDPTPFTHSTWDDCPDDGSDCRWTDSAWAERRNNVDFDVGHVAKPDGRFTTDVDPAGTRFRLTDESGVAVDDLIELVGKNAGNYQVEVDKTCENLQFGDVTLLCQIEATHKAGWAPDDGDSGSPAFRLISGNDYDLVGLMWGKKVFSTTIAIGNLGFIFLDLGGTWDVCVPGFSC